MRICGLTPLAAAFLVLVSGESSAQDGLVKPERHRFPNGVVLIVQEHRASDVASLQLWLRVGGRDEAPNELGLSHYLEHMLFKGTPTRPPGSIDRFVESVGGQSNAFTSYDTTHFDLLLPADQVAAGIELLADIAVNASFDKTELDRERQVVLEEMRLTEDDPDRFLLRRLAESAFGKTPYGRSILGTPALIEQLTREKLARYYRKRYSPKNMVVVVVGAVDPKMVRQAASRTFGKLKGTTLPRAPMPRQAPIEGVRSAVVPRPEKQAYLGLAWSAPAVTDRDVFAVDLLSYIIGDSPTSRLSVTVRDREGLVSEIEAGYISRQQAGIVYVTSRLDAENLEKAEAAILEVIRRVQTEGVTESERQRALITAESNYAFDAETSEGLSRVWGQAETTDSIESELNYLPTLRRTTAAQIQAAARKYLGPAYARVRFVPDNAPR
jgi:zinc protease